MSRDKLIIVGVVVLGCLSVLLYKQAKKDASLGRPVEATAELPTISAPDDIDKISITNGDKAEVVLERVADAAVAPGDAGAGAKWALSAPVKADASQQVVKDLIANLKDLKVESQVHLKLDDAVRKDKQLDTAHAVHVVAWKAGTKKLDELFGKSGAAGELVVVSSQPNAVWAAKGYSSFLYTKEPKDYRDKEIFHFDDGAASQVTVTNAHGTLSFTKGDKWAGTLDKRPIARLDEEKVKDMLRAYKALAADDFGDGKSLADTGLDRPEATLTIQLKDGAGNYQLLVGKTATGSNRWAKRADTGTIYQVTNFASEWAVGSEAKYQTASDAGAGDGAHKPGPKK